jgi:hypothetical protein
MWNLTIENNAIFHPVTAKRKKSLIKDRSSQDPQYFRTTKLELLAKVAELAINITVLAKLEAKCNGPPYRKNGEYWCWQKYTNRGSKILLVYSRVSIHISKRKLRNVPV